MWRHHPRRHRDQPEECPRDRPEERRRDRSEERRRDRSEERPRDPEVQVLRIPADGSAPYVKTVRAGPYNYRDCKASTATTEKMEFNLGCVPDLKGFGEYFDLRYRNLFDRNLDVNNPDPSHCGGTYYIYKCIDGAEAKLPRNRYFRDLKDVRVYGDAFVFKVEWVDEPIDGLYQPIFGEMVSFERNLKHHRGFERGKLDEMAVW